MGRCRLETFLRRETRMMFSQDRLITLVYVRSLFSEEETNVRCIFVEIFPREKKYTYNEYTHHDEHFARNVFHSFIYFVARIFMERFI